MSVTVLFVDDSPSIRRYCQEELEAAGFRVRLACDGEEALDAVEQSAPDVVVMDVHMPRCGGLEALVRLRGLHPALPVILHTSGSGDWIGRSGLRCVRKREDLSPLCRAITEELEAHACSAPMVGLPLAIPSTLSSRQA
jgi:CheY-like chemotaxis protein